MIRDNQKNSRALELIRRVTDEVENIRPSKDEMINDIKMMSFKVRSISGDIFEAASRDFGFIESLWKISRIEQLVGGVIESMDETEREIVFRFLDDLEFSAQQKINSAIQSLPPQDKDSIRLLKLEIFRERKFKKDLN